MLATLVAWACLACAGTPVTYLDQSYGVSAWQVFDAYIPPNPVAVAVYVHGGGRAADDEDVLAAVYQPLFDRDIAVVSCDYAGYDTEGGVFPVPQRDVAGCLTFLDSNRATYGLGTAKLGLLGRSYGGMLSAGVAYAPQAWYMVPEIEFFVDVVGMVDWRVLDPAADPAWQHINGSPWGTALLWASGQWHLEQGYGVVPPETYIWHDLATPGTPPLLNPHDPYFGVSLHRQLDRMGAQNEIHLGNPVLDMAEIGDFILNSI